MSKFNKTALANSLAILSGLVYIVFYLIGVVAPTLFESIYNAQFLGADVASLVPEGFSIGILVVLVVTTWIIGYIWGILYNKFAK